MSLFREINSQLTNQQIDTWINDAHNILNGGGATDNDVSAASTVLVLCETIQELRSAHTNFMMPSRIPNIERRSPQEVEDICRAMLRNMFARAGLQLHEQPEEDPDLPPAFICSECGFETSDPEGRHYCHEDNSDE